MGPYRPNGLGPPHRQCRTIHIGRVVHSPARSAGEAVLFGSILVGMNIDLDGLLAVTGSLDLISTDLTVGVPAVTGVVADPEILAVLDRVQAAATAARAARLADLTDLIDGIGSIRTLWIAAENAGAAVPE